MIMIMMMNTDSALGWLSFCACVCERERESVTESKVLFLKIHRA